MVFTPFDQETPIARVGQFPPEQCPIGINTVGLKERTVAQVKSPKLQPLPTGFIIPSKGGNQVLTEATLGPKESGTKCKAKSDGIPRTWRAQLKKLKVMYCRALQILT